MHLGSRLSQPALCFPDLGQGVVQALRFTLELLVPARQEVVEQLPRPFVAPSDEHHEEIAGEKPHLGFRLHDRADEGARRHQQHGRGEEKAPDPDQPLARPEKKEKQQRQREVVVEETGTQGSEGAKADEHSQEDGAIDLQLVDAEPKRGATGEDTQYHDDVGPHRQHVAFDVVGYREAHHDDRPSAGNDEKDIPPALDAHGLGFHRLRLLDPHRIRHRIGPRRLVRLCQHRGAGTYRIRHSRASGCVNTRHAETLRSRHFRSPSVIFASPPPLRHSRESGNPGVVEGALRHVSPLPPSWVPAFAGMTEGGGNDGEEAGMAWEVRVRFVILPRTDGSPLVPMEGCLTSLDR